MKIWNVPIESLEERYSADWNRWFPREFQNLGVEYEHIPGDPLTMKIERGSFLDVIGTNYYKASQIQMLCKEIYHGLVKDDDVIFFNDLWFPGLESLAYIRDALGLKFKIVGILHAGTWDSEDFLSRKGMIKWAKQLEESWFSFVDCIFVATHFHKSLIENSRFVQCPIHVTGLPIYDERIHSTIKEKIIVFPHRLDSEKQPEEFDRLENMFREECPELSDWRFIKSKDYTSSKKTYYDLLNASTFAVSTAYQETWGIAMQEALFAGCIPIVPNRLSYTEMYHEKFLYRNLMGVAYDIGNIISHPNLLEAYQDLAQENKEELLAKGELAIPNIVRIMKEL